MSKRPMNDGNLALKRTYEDGHETELDTNPLRSGRLRLVPRPQPEERLDHQTPGDHLDPATDTTIWLRQQTVMPRSLSTGKLDEEDIPLSAHRAGFGEHAAAPRMVPTIGSRVRTGVRKSTLLVLLSVAVGAALVGAGYLLAITPWLANVTGSAPPATTNEAPLPPGMEGGDIPQSPGQIAAKDDQSLHSDLPAPQPPTTADKATRDEAIEAYKQGDYSKAARLLESYVLVSGDDAVAYYHLGLAYMALTGQDYALADAELALRTSISLQPDWAAPYQALAETLMRLKLYTDAIAPAQKATELTPAAPEVWLTLGRAYQGAGRESEATRAFAQASYLAPSPPLP